MPKSTQPALDDLDVFICCLEPEGSEVAGVLASGLSARKFRVFMEPRTEGEAGEARRRAVIDETPDFVLVATPGLAGALADPTDPVRDEVAHALDTARNIVLVTTPGASWPGREALPPGLEALAEAHRLSYRPDRTTESIALLWHRLSSQVSLHDRREMKGVKRWFVAAFAFVLLIVVVEVARQVPRWLERPPDTRPLAPFALSWAGFGERQEGERAVPFALGRDTAVRPGDRLKLVFNPRANGHVYAIARSDSGRVAVLFPTSALKSASRVQAGQFYEGPVETRWLVASEAVVPGTVYLVGSYDPIQNFEELVEGNSAGRATDPPLSLLDSTIPGLLDGRHGALGRAARTSGGRPIVESLQPVPGPAETWVTLSDGSSVTYPLATEVGRLSATVEIRLHYEDGARR